MHELPRAIALKVRRNAGCLGLACLASSTVAAQYSYNPANADERPGIRYFGSAKDTNGALLPDVSVRIYTLNLTYLLVTNEQGRFSVQLPLETRSAAVKLSCFKEGFQVVQLTRRPSSLGPKPTVQADCVLRAVRPG